LTTGAGVAFFALFFVAVPVFFVDEAVGGGEASSTGVEVLLLFAAGVEPVSFAGVDDLLGGMSQKDINVSFNVYIQKSNQKGEIML
jgi:hypothetical protein